MISDLSFNAQGGVFSLRAAAIIAHQNRVLLSRGEDAGFWVLPGGRIRMFESAKDSLCRELHEETGFRFTSGRLAWVVESFFTYRATHFHEVAFYFMVSPTPECIGQIDQVISRPDSPKGGPNLTLRWHSLDALPNLKPAFLSLALCSIPSTPRHLVLIDGEIQPDLTLGIERP